MNKIQIIGYSLAASTLLTVNTFAALFGEDRIDSRLDYTGQKTLEQAVQGGINWFTGFLYIIAVCYGLYGGFLMMTAGGDEEKVKKGRTILIQVGIGLLVIFLASSIVSWVLSLLSQSVN